MPTLIRRLSPLGIILLVVFSFIPTRGQALTYDEAKSGQTGLVLGDSTAFQYPTGSLVNENGAIYFIYQQMKIPFTNWSSFVGLGYSLRNVVSGSLEDYPISQSYFIDTPNQSHPWGQFLLYNKTIYYSDSSGLIGVPSWDVFLNNGANSKLIVKANSSDIGILKANPNLPLLTANDPRLSYNNTLSVSLPTFITPTATSSAAGIINPTPTGTTSPTQTPVTPTSTAEVINTLSYFLDTKNQTLTGTHALSQTVTGQTIYNVKWSNDSYETYSYDNNYIYLKEDHSGSPNPGSYTFSNGKWMKLNMQVGEQIDASDNHIQNFTVSSNSCTPATTGSFPYTMTLLQHLPSYDLGGSLGVQDVIVLQYDYRAGGGTNYEKSYYAKGWGLVKWELYNSNNQVTQTSIFNQPATVSATAPNVQSACINAPISQPNPTPTLPVSLNGFVTMLYSCVVQNNNPDSAGYNNWLQNLQSGALDIKTMYTQFYTIQNTLNPALSNDTFTKQLYRCMLFRDPDTASYNNVIAALSSSSQTRSNLVQSVLASSEFNTVVLPKLQALIPVQVTPAPVPSANVNVPTVPASLNAFVRTLYSCVLNNSAPDTSGFNFWLNNLQTHAITIPGIYTQMFGYQSSVSPAIMNDQFIQKLYGCILFRPADQTSYNNVMTGLSNGTLTKANLVQTVLTSPEFTTGILPKLQKLIP